ncbi:MAG: flavodoxin domain-containing protein [Solirubrobacterales bacterium]
MKVLVSAASKYGATGEIAAAIGEELRARGIEAVVVAPEGVDDVREYDGVVLGSAVYAGRWLGPARDLAGRSSEALRSRPVWLFSSGPVGDPSRKLVRKMGADPVDLPKVREKTAARDHHMFSGKIDRKNLPLFQRTATVLFRMDGDFRDWSEVREWASRIADDLQAAPAPTEPARGSAGAADQPPRPAPG